jgi:hypothetical protein
MAAPVARYFRRLLGRQAWIEEHALAMDRHQQLLLETGRVLMMLAAVVLTHLLGTTAAASNDAELLPISLLLWLISTALTMTSLVARQFPTLAAAGVNVARALRNYLIGGL